MKLISLFVVLLIILVSCYLDLSLDFFVGDHANEQIINSQGIVIKCNQPEFSSFGCLHKDDIKELRKWINENCDQDEGKAKILDFILQN